MNRKLWKTKQWLQAAGVAVIALHLAGCGHDPEGAVHHDDPHDDRAEVGHDDHGGDHDDHDDHDSDVVRLTPEAIARIGLETAEVGEVVLEGRTTTTGKIGFDEERLAQIGSRTSGRLVEIPARLGAKVGAGEAMAVVDSTELGEAKAAFLRARARREVTERRYRREEALRADRISSEQELLEAEGAAKEAAADYAESRETLLLLGLREAEIEALHWQDPEASLTVVRAPFAGKVVERNATLGELVTPADTLFLLADLGEVWLWIDVYERDLSRVRLGQPVAVRLDAWPDEVFEGTIAYLADRLDPDSRTLGARVDLANPDGRLRPGMFARVTLGDGAAGAPAVTAVPRTAVQRDGEGSVVFVRTEPEVFERRRIEPGRITDGWVEVLAGVSPGEEVVTRGAFLLKSQASADELGGHHH